MTDPMRALTVRQPWASAIAYGDKRIENRSRPIRYRGLLAIHAGLGVEWDAPARAWLAAGLTPPGPRAQRRAWKASLALGAVVAVAFLEDVHLDAACWKASADGRVSFCSPWAQRDQYHWQLTGVRLLAEPVPCKGRLGLWALPSDIDTAVRTQLETADASS